MIVRRFLLWARTASAQQRADGARALAQAYLVSPMSPDDRREAETAFLALVQDPSPLVRRALAEVLAPAVQTPRALAVALVAEGGEPAALMLRLSPRLSDEELVDAAAVGGALAQCAVAGRESVSAGLAAALAEIGSEESLLTLTGNPGATILPGAFERMLERFGDRAELREALLDRGDLPGDLRQTIAVRVSEALCAFVTGAGWLSAERAERVQRDATERVAVDLADQGGDAEVMALIRRLRLESRLTPALMLRAMVFAAPALAEAAFAELAGFHLPRVRALIYDRNASGFPALYRRAGLPLAFQSAFSTAAEALAALAQRKTRMSQMARSRFVLSQVIAAAERDGAGALLALLRRFEAECARIEAQALADSFADDAALRLVIEADPSLLIEHAADPLAGRITRLAA